MKTGLTASNEAKIKKHLSSVIRYCNKNICIDTWLIDLKSEGYKPEIKEVPAVEYNRTKFNRLTGWEQQQYEKRLNEKKTEYRAIKDNSILVLSKIEYDYFTSLFLQQITM